MTRTGKIILFSSIGLVAIVSAILLVRKSKKDKLEDSMKKDENGKDLSKAEIKEVKKQNASIAEVGEDEITTKTLIPSDYPPLKIGSRGRFVATLQMALNYVHGLKMKVDGRFGGELRDALRDYEGFYCGGGWTGGLFNSECAVTMDEYSDIHHKARIKSGEKAWVKYTSSDLGYKNVVKEYAKTTISGGGVMGGIADALADAVNKEKTKSNFSGLPPTDAIDCKENNGQWKYNKIARDWGCI